MPSLSSSTVRLVVSRKSAASGSSVVVVVVVRGARARARDVREISTDDKRKRTYSPHFKNVTTRQNGYNSSAVRDFRSRFLRFADLRGVGIVADGASAGATPGFASGVSAAGANLRRISPEAVRGGASGGGSSSGGASSSPSPVAHASSCRSRSRCCSRSRRASAHSRCTIALKSPPARACSFSASLETASKSGNSSD
eukprot:scaffold45461_cov62-Phaeocystis_antarctica.AAC.9